MMAGRTPRADPASGGHRLTGLTDAGAFLARLVRLDPDAPVRLRSAGRDRTELWARLPWAVLVQRTVAGPGPGDATVSAAELLARLTAVSTALPPRRDSVWRWPLPPGPARAVEVVPAADLRRVAVAAAGTLRAAETQGVGGRAVGQRAVRDALLDHVAVVVTDDGPTGGRIEIRQGLVQAVARMGFLGTTEGPVGRPEPVDCRDRTDLPGRPADPPQSVVRVRTVGNWVALDAPFGVAWTKKVNDLALTPTITQPKV
ncbi:hypothetical protein [Micromonospora sp. LOL_015]|uniref:hypothetical protein n=2 Tax=Micromonospora TaxID=1873 RepID=UPI003A881623